MKGRPARARHNARVHFCRIDYNTKALTSYDGTIIHLVTTAIADSPDHVEKSSSIETDATTARTLPAVPPEQVLTSIEQSYMFHQGFKGTDGWGGVNIPHVHVSGDGWVPGAASFDKPVLLMATGATPRCSTSARACSRRSARWRSQSSSRVDSRGRGKAKGGRIPLPFPITEWERAYPQ